MPIRILAILAGLVAAIFEVFPPEVAQIIVDWMVFRFEWDATLTEEARAFFLMEVDRAFARG